MAKKSPDGCSRANEDGTGVSPDEETWLIAAAAQADRIRVSAQSVAAWAITYHKHKQFGDRIRDRAAYSFADSAVTLAMTVIWNKVTFGHGGWHTKAGAASALAYDLVVKIPEVYTAALTPREGEMIPLDQARAIAATHATIRTARVCLDIVTLLPELFDGPDGPQRHAHARAVWRELHGVTDQAPINLDERTKIAFTRVARFVSPSVGAPAASGTKAQISPENQPETRSSHIEPVEQLRSEGKPTRAALVEYMKGRTSSRRDDIAHHVHGYSHASDQAIRANITRTNEDLEGMGLPTRFHFASGYVFKDEPRE